MMNDKLVGLFPPIDESIKSTNYNISMAKHPFADVYMVSYCYRAEEYDSIAFQYTLETKVFCTSIGMNDEDVMLWLLKYGEYLPLYYVNGELMVAHLHTSITIA